MRRRYSRPETATSALTLTAIEEFLEKFHTVVKKGGMLHKYIL